MPERVTTAEAARRLGLSVATVKRKIAAGELLAERELRPQGARWWVIMDGASAAQSAEERSGSKQASARERAHERVNAPFTTVDPWATIATLTAQLAATLDENRRLREQLQAPLLMEPYRTVNDGERAHERGMDTAQSAVQATPLKRSGPLTWRDRLRLLRRIVRG